MAGDINSRTSINDTSSLRQLVVIVVVVRSCRLAA